MVSPPQRNPAGKALIAFATLALVVASFAAYLRANRERDEFAALPTALGDTEFYAEDLGPGFDIFHPNLRFEGIPARLAAGLYRRNHNPVNLADSKAKRLAREEGDRHWVYVHPSKDGKSLRYFLKADADAFIEFGEQKYFPSPGDNRPGVKLEPNTPGTSGENTGNPAEIR